MGVSPWKVSLEDKAANAVTEGMGRSSILYLAKLCCVKRSYFCRRICGFNAYYNYHGLTPMATCCHRFRDSREGYKKLRGEQEHGD
jgi:hypothetical protein